MAWNIGFRPRMLRGNNGLVLLLNTIIDENHAWYKVLRERTSPLCLEGILLRTEVLGTVLLQLSPSIKVLEMKKNIIKNNPLTLKSLKEVIKSYVNNK